MKKFSQLQPQDKFEAREKVYKKVSSDLAADVRFAGDACVERFGGNEEVNSLTDEQAEARVKELAEEREQAEASEESPVALTADETQQPDAATIRKMKRDELDELAERNEIDLESLNVEESREYLIAELHGEEAKS